MFWAIASTIVGIAMAGVMIVVRSKASKRPTNAIRIMLPPLFMSTGALMFIFPVFQISWQQVLEAFFVGVIFSVFLIKTSNFEINNGAIYLIPSKIFILVLILLLIIRVAIIILLSQTISFGETSGMFFILAFGMIITWRLAMVIKYKKLAKQL